MLQNRTDLGKCTRINATKHKERIVHQRFRHYYPRGLHPVSYPKSPQYFYVVSTPGDIRNLPSTVSVVSTPGNIHIPYFVIFTPLVSVLSPLLY